MQRADTIDGLSEDIELINGRGIPFYVKRILIIYLLVLPLQSLPAFLGVESGVFIKIISYIDEITTIMMFYILLTFIALKPSLYRINKNVVPTNLFLLFVLMGLFSMGLNRINPIQGIFGLYNLIKNLILIYFFASLKWDRGDLFFLAKGIVAMTIILAIFGIAGEVLALLGQDSHNLVEAQEYRRRHGLYRVHSFLGYGHSNYLGMYAVLAFFLSDFMSKRSKINTIIKLIIFILVFFTVSRAAWLCIALLFIIIRKQIKSGYVFFALFAATAGLFILFITLESHHIVDPEHYYRAFAYLRSFELFIGNPIIGVGPGMFGDITSIIFDSPYYSDWPAYFEDLFMRSGGIDSFWTVILVQTGFLGFVIFGMIFTRLYKNMQDAVDIFRREDAELFKLGGVLKSYIIALILLGLSSGINKPYVVYTYFGLYGIYMSVYMRFSRARNGSLSLIT